MTAFSSFFQAGFECATHTNIHKKRLDIVAATSHDIFVRQDYARLKELGIHTVREGARWHVIETSPGVYDFSSLALLYDAAQELDIEIVLDLMHFGWPDHVDIFGPEFVSSFERFAAATARFLDGRGLAKAFVLPVNEISYLSWAGGDQAAINPHARGRGGALKKQLVEATIRASRVLRRELPSVCIASAEPVIHIVGRESIPGDCFAAEKHRLAMFEAWDMLTGKSHPELGGRPDYLDVVGVNFYDRNQWVNHGETLAPEDARYRPFHQILIEVWKRYGCPMFVSETGTEDDARPSWLAYVGAEVRKALERGVPIHGICLYPILNHPGWDDDRHCCNGLYDYADENGNREMFLPLAEAIEHQQALHRAFVASEDPDVALIA